MIEPHLPLLVSAFRAGQVVGDPMGEDLFCIFVGSENYFIDDGVGQEREFSCA